MRLRLLFPLCLALALAAQIPRQQPPEPPPGEIRLPNGKLQRDEILKADYEKSLQDSRDLARLAGELKTDLEKSDHYILSLQSLKKTEEIEKLAKRIHDRIKHY